MSDSVLAQLRRRGFVQQSTGEGELAALLASGPQTVYTGYDPTGDSLHVGHLVTLMALRRLRRDGHRVLIVVGGATALVGDPSGKTAARPMLDAEAVAHNAGRLLAQVRQVLGSDDGVTLLDNAAWLQTMGYLQFLREVGRHFSVNRMLSAETYKTRLEHGLSFLEFNYQLLQAYDFAHLARHHGCRLQLGGDDQWSNILAGVELCRRQDRLHAHGLTVPLLTTASGAKMGKTAEGAVWLAADRLHPNDFFQYWVNVDDRDVERFLRLYTDLPEGEIEASGAHDPNACKRVLAYEVTRVVHGAQAAHTALRAAVASFGGAVLPAELLASSDVPRDVTAGAGEGAPNYALEAALGAGPWPLVAVLVKLGWARTGNEARRLVAQGAVKFDGTVVTDGQRVLAATEVAAEGTSLHCGKKRRVVLLP